MYKRPKDTIPTGMIANWRGRIPGTPIIRSWNEPLMGQAGDCPIGGFNDEDVADTPPLHNKERVKNALVSPKEL